MAPDSLKNFPFGGVGLRSSGATGWAWRSDIFVAGAGQIAGVKRTKQIRPPCHRRDSNFRSEPKRHLANRCRTARLHARVLATFGNCSGRATAQPSRRVWRPMPSAAGWWAQKASQVAARRADDLLGVSVADAYVATIITSTGKRFTR
jgi:hypothetical protein